MEIQKMALLMVWGYKKSGESYVKETIICENKKKAEKLGMKFKDTTTVNDGFISIEMLIEFANYMKKGE